MKIVHVKSDSVKVNATGIKRMQIEAFKTEFISKHNQKFKHRKNAAF